MSIKTETDSGADRVPPVLHEVTGDGGHDVLSSPSPRTAVRTQSDLSATLPRAASGSRANTVHPRTALIHFGCRLNQFESDGIKANLADNAHSLTDNMREADFVVINTCTVTNKADYKNRAAIRRAHRLNPQAKIVVTGCYATTDAEELRSLPGVYRVVSNDQKHRIAAMLGGTDSGETPNDRFFFSANHDLKSRATLKIQDGCNKSCSYCKIPQARGRGVSRAAGETLESARELIAAGFGELVLTGVNIGWYEDNGVSFNGLVEALLDLPGDFHLRVSSIEPGDVTERFAAFYQHPKMARFLHIPLQSGSKFVLRTMRRGYTPENFMRRIEYVRKICPEAHIGTDVIVGFPAEGDTEFRETLDFCRTADFANIHIFPFSKRRNTPIVDWLGRRHGGLGAAEYTDVRQAARRQGGRGDAEHTDVRQAARRQGGRGDAEYTDVRQAAEKRRIYREVNGAIIRERSATLSALKKEMAENYIRRMEGRQFAAIAERIENGTIHFLTENYLRGVLPAAEHPALRRGNRFTVTWSQALLAPEKGLLRSAL